MTGRKLEANMSERQPPELISERENLWRGIQLHYDRVFSGETVGCNAEHHVLVALLSPCQQDRWLGEQFQHEHMTGGDSFLVPQGLAYRLYRFTSAEGIRLVIEPEFLHRVAAETFDQSSVELMPHFAHSNPLIMQILLELRNDLAAGCPAGLIYGESLIHALATYLLRHYAVRCPQRKLKVEGLPSAKLQQAIDYIQAHLSQDVSLEAIATEVGMSRYHFARLFKQSTGQTPHRYVSQCRVKQAKRLLTEESLSIAEISQRLGFVNQHQFAAFFRKQLGISPTQYRRRL